jgi:hypothetical protein
MAHCDWPGCPSMDAKPVVLQLHEADNATHLHAATNKYEWNLCDLHAGALIEWLRETPFDRPGALT